MKDCSSSVAPIVKGDKLNLSQRSKNDFEMEEMKKIPYGSAIGSLIMLGRYQSNTGLDQWRDAKKMMRYLQCTKDYKLMFRRNDNMEVVGYSDSDFAGCVDSHKSTSGYVFLFASGAMSWRSTKQTLTTTFTMEADCCIHG
ncbi:secreted RxLR effector protein 161-like [Humulus lupulus]|uniref:secreted RxLR effector protein 161-like n=1 Tax=Humulus lupulus TaxID=3486 RepID=UPI002B410BE1|nr:secreted RxLR effector protein 161-like [Humulus lupulus]